MKNGYKIWDTDTHVRPTAETIEQFLSAPIREQFADPKYRTPRRVGMAGERYQEPLKHYFRIGEGGGGEGWGSKPPRRLGEAGPRPNEERQFQTFMGSRFPTDGGGDDRGDVRLRDMDEEGTDVHTIVHSAHGSADPEVEAEFIRAEHRYMDAFCGADPHRLKSLIVVTPRQMELSVQQIHEWGKKPWSVGVIPSLPLDYPIDHPDMDAIWRAAQEEALTIVHHSFAAGYPGYRDLWDSPFIGRTASHPWAAQRAVAAFVGSGIMDRFPDLKFCILESGFGWLPSWAARMDDQMIYMGYVAEGLKHRPSEYLENGRFFAGIVLNEGEPMVRMVTEYMGDGILMLGTDYPHAESRFPESINQVMSFESIQNGQMHKLLYDNAVRCFGEP
jgi:predicted TIM-barrel fold metal-dependent hydrolase